MNRINLKTGLWRATLVVSILTSIIGTAIGISLTNGEVLNKFEIVVLWSACSFVSIWIIYWVLKYVIDGFVASGEKKTVGPIFQTENTAKIISTTIRAKKPTLGKATLWFVIQFGLSSAIAGAAGSTEIHPNLYWLGCILGWGSLFMGIAHRKYLLQNKSNSVANGYAWTGFALLFIGSFPVMWAFCVLHQLYPVNYDKKLKDWLISLLIACGLFIATVLPVYLLASKLK